MGRRPDPNTDRRAEEAAYLSGEKQISRALLAKHLGTTVSNVSRLLARARQMKCYSETVVRRFHAEQVSPDRLAALHAPEQSFELLRLLQAVDSENGVKVGRVFVVPSQARHRPDGSIEPGYLAEFGRGAAPSVADWLVGCAVVAVTWGTTLSSVVDGLSMLGRRQEGTVTVIPVCAEAERSTGRPEASSSLAARLNGIVNSAPGEPLSLTRAPAFVPRRFLGTPLEDGARQMIWSSTAYQRIFGTPAKDWSGATGGLVDQADLLLTSVGSAEHPVGFNYDELLQAGGIQASKLSRVVVGDLGGILIKRDQVRGASSEVRALNRMWTGFDFGRLEALALRAARSDGRAPGVVVVSAGKNRDEILAAVVRRGLVNALVLDASAAAGLVRRLS